MRVYLDMDGVLADLHDEWVRRLNRAFGTDYTAEDVTQWEMAALWPDAPRDQVYAPLNHLDLYDYVLPIPGALEGARQLQAAGHDVYVTTSCTSPDMIAGKVGWLLRHQVVEPDHHGGIPRQFVAVRDKSILGAPGVMVDDYPKNLRGFKGQRILFTAPHNADEHGLFEWTRADTWGEVVRLVGQLPDDPPWRL